MNHFKLPKLPPSTKKIYGLTFSLLTALAGLSTSLAGQAQEQSIDSISRRMAECEFTYAYAAQVLQLRNNEGAGRNLLNRASMIGIANMMNNEVNGTIAGWKIREFTAVRGPLKRAFDSGKVDSISAASACDVEMMPVALRVRETNKKLWGKSYDELRQGMFEKLRVSLGL